MSAHGRRSAVIIIAVLLVIGFVAMPRYATSALASAAGSIVPEVKSFALVNRLDAPDRSIYRMTLKLTNRGNLPVRYSAYSVELSFMPNHDGGGNGHDQGRLVPLQSVEITREVVILETTLADLRAAGQLSVDVELTTLLEAKWLWWGMSTGSKLSFEHTFLFD